MRGFVGIEFPAARSSDDATARFGTLLTLGRRCDCRTLGGRSLSPRNHFVVASLNGALSGRSRLRSFCLPFRGRRLRAGKRCDRGKDCEAYE
jgi:hypothetical protein